MKRLLLASLLASLCGAAGTASAADIEVMTQNQYLGTDLAPVITAAPDKLNDEIIKALENVAATLPQDRLGKLAKLISDRGPHVVVLNEAFSFSCENVAADTPPNQGCGNQRIKGAFVDFLAATEANLAGKYVTKGLVQNFAVSGLQFEIDDYSVKLTVKDRDAILVRGDLASASYPVPLASSGACRPTLAGNGCNYLAVPEVPTALGLIRVERGYTAADLLVGGQWYRVFATHLEQRQLTPGNVESMALQRMQAAELIQVAYLFPTQPGTRKLIVGDINSAPNDDPTPIPTLAGPLPPPYFIFTNPAPPAGYTDTWTLRPGTATANGAPVVGSSCCQDEDLANHNSKLYERIDMIFSLGSPKKVLDARLLGDTPASKTWPPGLGLWASDHASVAARLQY